MLGNKMISIGDFCIADTPVTVGFFNCVCEKAAPLGYDLVKRNGKATHPVTLVSYFDSVKFCNALSEILGIEPAYYMDDAVFRAGDIGEVSVRKTGAMRLPTEQEWEMACKAGTSTRYYWGDMLDSSYAHYFTYEDMGKVYSVGEKLPNAYGLYDMSGNVYEWCDTDSGIPPLKALRGGSIALDSVLDSDVSAYAFSYFTSIETGFRIASDNVIFIPEELLKSDECKVRYNVPRRSFEEIFKPGTTVQRILEHLSAVNLDADFKLFYTEEYLEQLMELKSPVAWFEDENCKILGQNCETAKVLVQKWIDTKQKKYLDKWLEIYDDFACHAKNIFDSLPPEKMRINNGTPNFWAYSQGYDTPRRARAIMSSLVKIAKNIKPSEIDEQKFKNIFVMLLTDDLNITIKDPRRPIPNQALSNGKTLLMYARLFPLAKCNSLVLKLGEERFKQVACHSGYMKDGGDLEQSYNYNIGLINEYLEIDNLFDGKMPDSLQELQRVVLYRARMLKAVTLPFGGLPATGTSSSHYPPSLYNDKQALKAYTKEYMKKNYPFFEKIEVQEFGVGSMAFPYSGYYVMRDSFEEDGVYLWLMGARRGMGHYSENVNAISLCAYGINMLVNAGAYSYRNKSFVPPEQHDIIDRIDCYKDSSFGENTICIDGNSQTKFAGGENHYVKSYTTPIDARFHTDDCIDFAEGFYYGPYGEIKAVHNRQIIFIKKLKIFVILDYISAQGSHNFTSCFHIMPDGIEVQNAIKDVWVACGFANDDIKIEKNKIYTQKENAPNMSIYVFGQDVHISRHYGELSPQCCGWLASSIVGKRHKKVDIHVDWQDDGDTKLVTVISPFKENREVIHEIIADEKANRLQIITSSGEEVEVKEDSIQIDGCKYYFSDFEKPSDFRWEEHDGKLYPKYD